ncbi:MAG: NifB/NifX family molybdenum-iron cluster-binding protein [Pseudomonas sp.]|jgi:predicted Fe-Mo cluster-binding NifX family protein|nr:NifB/NifX family molybdenum-iron cluster-binding protein [Pseudomonas sp.]
MKIAVTSQNRKIITEHAGRCRKFWIFTTQDKHIIDKQLLELPKEQSFHDSSNHEPHPLDDIDLLIAGGMGQGLSQRLARKGIQSLTTKETDPETAVLLYLKGQLKTEQPEVGHHHSHEHSEHDD